MNNTIKAHLTAFTVVALIALPGSARAEGDDRLSVDITPVPEKVESINEDAKIEPKAEEETPDWAGSEAPLADETQFADVCQYAPSAMITAHLRCPFTKRKNGVEYPSSTAKHLREIAEEVCKLSYDAQVAKNKFLKDLPGDANDTNFDERLRRVTHSKTHGCATGKFTIEKAENIPKELRAGMFGNSNGKSFDVWARMANGNAGVHSDTEPDANSLSFKVIGVDGPKLSVDGEHSRTFDFVMNNAPTFFLKSPDEFLSFFRVVMAPKQSDDKHEVEKRIGGFLLKGDRVDEVWELGKIALKPYGNLLQDNFYSGTAYSWGDRVPAVKYGLRSTECPGYDIPKYEVDKHPGANYKRELLQKQLHDDKKSACWDFGVQVQSDAWKTPIEDPTHEWKEKDAPFVVLGHLTFPPQDMKNEEKLLFCDGLKFSNWNVTKEFRPLGDMNKARRWADYCSAQGRLKFNHQSLVEPTGKEKFGDNK